MNNVSKIAGFSGRHALAAALSLALAAGCAGVDGLDLPDVDSSDIVGGSDAISDGGGSADSGPADVGAPDAGGGADVAVEDVAAPDAVDPDGGAGDSGAGGDAEPGDGGGEDVVDPNLSGPEPPSVTFVTPQATFVAIGSALTIRVVVQDDGPVDQVALQWSIEDVGAGTTQDLGELFANEAGVSEVNWVPPAFGTYVVTVKATDNAGNAAEASKTLSANGPPTKPAVSILPLTPKTGDNLSAVIDQEAVDDSGQPVTYVYAWTVDGADAGVAGPEVDAGATTRGESWSVVVTPIDSDGAAGLAASATVTVVNTAPSAPELAVQPQPVDLASALTCDVVVAPADPDADELDYTWGWKVGDYVVPGAEQATTTVAQLTKANGALVAVGDAVSCFASVSDGFVDSPVATSAPAAVEAYDVCADPALNPCAADAACTNTSTLQPDCACKVGFVGDGFACTDLDECFEGLDACHPNADCQNAVGSYTCTCKPGYDGNGFACADVDECANGTAGCADAAACKNTKGGFDCGCGEGFVGDGVVCEDLDECAAGVDACDLHAACTNTVGSYGCECNAGFAGDGFECTDINECSDGSAGCDANATCLNKTGSFVCDCNDGYDGDGFACADIDECALGLAACDPNAACTNEVGSYACACEPGWTGDGFACADVDECAEASDDCGENAVCLNTLGSFTCACAEGYEGDGKTCVDIDECALGLDSCAAQAVCTNTVGGFACGCGDGFTGDGKTCADVNECLLGTDDCDANAKCNNTIGAFSCVCKAGYVGDGNACLDVDECAEGTAGCHPKASCTNTDGGFLCACGEGYQGDGVACADVDECAAGLDACDLNASCTNTIGSYGCDCDVGFEGDGFACANIDECADGLDACDLNASCTDTVGSYECACNGGFAGDGFACSDVDECADGLDDCDSNATCKNKIGSYICDCNDGYTGDGSTCFDINECGLKLDQCHPDAACSNTAGSYTCACDPGYSGDGFDCVNIDECAEGTDNCDANASCADTKGSFECTCNPGYEGDGVSCVDIDECLDPAACDANATCANSDGGFGCTCNVGYVGDGLTYCNVAPTEPGDLIITEFLANPAQVADTAGEWFEVYNPTQTAFDLSELSVADNALTVALPTANPPVILAPGAFAIIGRNADAAQNGGVQNLLQTQAPGLFLSNGGDEIRLIGKDGKVLDEVVFSSGQGGWPLIKSGQSLRYDFLHGTEDGDNDDGARWCLSSTPFGDGDAGTPGLAHDACDANGACTYDDVGGNGQFSVNCSCNSGYALEDGDCVDIDECADPALNDCDANAKCSNNAGSYSCGCDPGYTGDGVNCVNIDECADDLDDCDANATCTDTDGSFTCACNAGYDGDGKSCTDIDECGDPQLNDCDANATCSNEPGTFSCACNAGYEGDGTQCVDIDECDVTKVAASEDFSDPIAAASSWGIANSDDLVGWKFVEGALYYGQAVTGGYDNGQANSGTAVSPKLAVPAQGATLSFSLVFDVEDESDYDLFSIVAKAPTGDVVLASKATGLTVGAAPQAIELDLSAVAGQEVAVSFEFDTIDDQLNGVADVSGIWIDDIVVRGGSHDCDANATCANAVGSFTCSCDAGYFGDGKSCADVLECDDPQLNNCDANATCTEEPGTFSCACNSGYAGDGTTDGTGCTDVDECADGSNDCDANATCANTVGSFECTCVDGYEGDGKTCTDIDECADAALNDCAAVGGVCTNEPATFSCACDTGFEGDGKTCTNIDECVATEPLDLSGAAAGDWVINNSDAVVGWQFDEGSLYYGDPASGTYDTPGSANNGAATTPLFTVWPGVNEVVIALSIATEQDDNYDDLKISVLDENDGLLGVVYDKSTSDPLDGTPFTVALDVSSYVGQQVKLVFDFNTEDELFNEFAGVRITEILLPSETYPCAAAATCQDTVGSYTCTCDVGYVGDGATCDEIDECAEGIDDCADVGGVCTNTPGSYECACAAGFTGDGKTCVDNDECSDPALNDCVALSTCENTPGGFQCVCDSGYQGDGKAGSTECTDVDECSDPQLNTCDANAACNNTAGSFECQCNAGFLGNGEVCTDVNECDDPALNNCSANAACSNTAGSFECACDAGYTGDGTTDGSGCADVDECADPGLNDCDANATCGNTVGSFNCSCQPGYVGDGKTCVLDCLNDFYDFESGDAGWTHGPTSGSTSGWQLSTQTGGDTPFTLGGTWFGTPNNGPQLGTEKSALVSPVFDASNGVTISFKSYISNETGQYDKEFLEVSYDGGVSWSVLIDSSSSEWATQKAAKTITTSIPAASGTANTRIRFRYDTIDGCCGASDIVGWFVDDVQIKDPACGVSP